MSTAYNELQLHFHDRNDWVLGKILERRAETHGDRPFLQWEEDQPLSFAEVNRRVNRLAHGLAAAGLQHGDRVMILLPNCLDFLITWFALNKLGAVEVPVNTHLRGSFLEHVANNCGARVAVTDAEFLPRLQQCEPQLAHLQTVYVRRREGPLPACGRLQVRDFAPLYSDCDRNPGIDVTCRDLAAIMFTSGTSGPSKGVLMPHAHLYFFGEQGANLVRLTGQDVYKNPFPFFHGNAQLLTVYPCLLAGARAVLYERFSASEWIDRVRRHGVTVTNMLGGTMDFIFKQPPRPDDRDNRLRVIECAPLAKGIADAFRERFGVAHFVESFGQTETCLPIMTPYGEERPPGAVGKVVTDWFEVRLVDPETDEPVPQSTVGELTVRARVPWIMCNGYNGNPEATAMAQRNLWWHTGDGLWQDAEGWFYFVDRVNDALRVRGENVSSYEVEQVVLGHPAVKECAAVSVPSELHGGEHEIKVCVVLHPGAALDPTALVQHCEEHMPYFAVPRYVEFMAELPRTPSEKVQKFILRRQGLTEATWDRAAAGVVLKYHQQRGTRR